MRKCEKDFRRVFSFLSCLLDALPLSKFNWATLPSTEKMIRKEIGVFYCSPTKFRVLNRELGKERARIKPSALNNKYDKIPVPTVTNEITLFKYTARGSAKVIVFDVF